MILKNKKINCIFDTHLFNLKQARSLSQWYFPHFTIRKIQIVGYHNHELSILEIDIHKHLTSKINKLKLTQLYVWVNSAYLYYQFHFIIKINYEELIENNIFWLKFETHYLVISRQWYVLDTTSGDILRTYFLPFMTT